MIALSFGLASSRQLSGTFSLMETNGFCFHLKSDHSVQPVISENGSADPITFISIVRFLNSSLCCFKSVGLILQLTQLN